MTIKPIILLYILIFFIKSTLVSAGIKPRIITNPIVIDDIVASGGTMGIVCAWESNKIAESVPSVTKGLFVPINANTVNSERYTVKINNIVSFKIGILGNTAIGIDPLTAKVTYMNGDATIISLNSEKNAYFKIKVHPVENGIELYNENTTNLTQITSIFRSTYECRIDANWNPRLRAFPNPTVDIASLSFFLPMHSKVNVLIYDSAGKIIFQNKNYQAQENYNEVRADISTQRAGLYNAVLEILLPNGTVIIRKGCMIQKI